MTARHLILVYDAAAGALSQVVELADTDAAAARVIELGKRHRATGRFTP